MLEPNKLMPTRSHPCQSDRRSHVCLLDLTAYLNEEDNEVDATNGRDQQDACPHQVAPVIELIIRLLLRWHAYSTNHTLGPIDHIIPSNPISKQTLWDYWAEV